MKSLVLITQGVPLKVVGLSFISSCMTTPLHTHTFLEFVSCSNCSNPSDRQLCKDQSLFHCIIVKLCGSRENWPSTMYQYPAF